MPIDTQLLRRSVELSTENMRRGTGGPFGAVICNSEGQIVSEGWNCVTSSNDPTAHAEIVAIRRAAEKLGRFDLSGHMIYSSCEPCPMCLSAIYWARLDRLVFANSREEAAAIGFDDAAIYEEIPKPIEERAIPTKHLPLEEAKAAFAEWFAKADRIDY